MDTNLAITLLTITVIILSVVIVAMLTAATVVLIKVQRIMKNIDALTHNLSAATEWLSPVSVVSNLAKLFRK